MPGTTFRRQIPNGGAETTRSIVAPVSLTPPVVRSGDAVQQPAVSPRPIPFLAAESVLAPASPSPRRDVFSTDDGTRNTNEGFAVMSFHGTRSQDRGTHAESIQSAALYKLFAKVSAVQIELRSCPCLSPVLRSYCQRSHRGPAAGSAGVGQREMPRGVAVQPTPRSGGRSHGSAKCGDQHQEDVKELKTDRGHREQVDGHQLLGVILQKCTPSLRRGLPATHHVFADATLTDVDAEFEQFAVDSGCTPTGILPAHLADQIPDLARNERSSGLAAPHFAGPEQSKCGTLPSYDRFWLDGGKRRVPATPGTG